MKNAIILFSGGLDSTTCLAIAKARGFICHALTFTYGQKHDIEVTYAKHIAKIFDIANHQVLSLPLHQIGGSSLIDKKLSIDDFSGSRDIPNTYVPARNTIFLSYALAFSEVIQAQDIFIGCNVIDYSGYPDCRPEYLEAFENMASLATKIAINQQLKVKIHAPLLKMNKSEIIQEGLRYGIDYSKTISCYRADQDGRACGSCDSCVYRKKGFKEAGVSDPTIYF